MCVNTFVPIRIREIQESTKSNQWLWKMTKNNIPDWITCRRDQVDLGHESKWQIGPGFLQVPVEAWLTAKDCSINNLPE